MKMKGFGSGRGPIEIFSGHFLANNKETKMSYF
jgi:hypothetical protein